MVSKNSSSNLSTLQKSNRIGYTSSNPSFAQFSATGGTITTSGSYKIHTFNNSTENFVVTAGSNLVNILL
jgi:hypothetical protein